MPYSDPDRQREYQNEWIKKRRRDWLADNGPCVDCGTWDELQVDHVDASTKVSHRVWSWTKARRDTELAKCVARCFACHHKKTLSFHENAHGEGHGSSKLTEAAVRFIRSSPMTVSELAKVFGLDKSNISRARRGIHWSHVD